MLSKSKKNKGYTLLELSISTSIIALIAVGGLAVVSKKQEADNIRSTFDRIKTIESSLNAYILENSRLPCPSSPTLLQTDALFGKSVEYNTVEKICDNDSNDDGNGENGIGILTNATGAVPVRTLGLSDAFTYDGWNRKFTYKIATSGGSTEDYNSSNFTGDIAILDIKGTNKTSINKNPPNNYGGIYVIISHGGNGAGAAWSKESNTPPAIVAGIESQNTKHNNNYYIQAPASEKFDDIVSYKLKSDIEAPNIISSPISIDNLTCNNAYQIIKNKTEIDTLSTTNLSDNLYDSAINVLRMCNNSPIDNTSPLSNNGLQIWLDSTDSKTIYQELCPSGTDTNSLTAASPYDNDNVGCWVDKSGNQRNATASAISSSPNYDVNSINNNNSLLFEDNDNLATDFSFINNSDYTLLFVAKRNSSTSDSYILSTSTIGGNANESPHFGFKSDGAFTFSQNQNDIDIDIERYDANTEPSILAVFKHDSTNGKIAKLEGYDKSYNIENSNTDSVANVTNYNIFNGSIGSNLNIGEIIAYDRSITDDKLSIIEHYLSDKWNISYQSSNSNLCAKGLVFKSTTENPKGSCSCENDEDIFFQNTSLESSCLLSNKLAYNKCQKPITSPTYNDLEAYSGQILWLDASDCSTIEMHLSSGNITNKVQKWIDKSPFKSEAVQNTSSKAPEYFYDPSSGKYVLDFSSDNLSIADASDIRSKNQGISAFSIVQAENINSDQFIFDIGTYATKGFGSLFKNSTPDEKCMYISSSNGGQELCEDLNVNVNKLRLYFDQVIFNSSVTGKEMQTSIDSSLSESRTDITITQLGDSQLGNNVLSIGSKSNALSNTIDGKIGEIILYDKITSDEEYTGIASYLGDKWNIYSSPAQVEEKFMWYDFSDADNLFIADNCTGVNATNNSSIGCIKDKSSKGNNAIQSTSAEQATYKIALMNDLAGVEFDGTDDNYEIDLSYLDDSNYYVYMVLARTSNKSHSYLLGSNRSGTTNEIPHFGFRDNTAFTFAQWSNDIDINISAYSSPLTILTKTYLDVRTGREGFVWGDGSVRSSSTTNISTFVSIASTDGRLGFIDNFGYFQGYAGEIIGYNHLIGETEQEHIEMYLSDKWDIPLE